ncbi:MAG: hypothetical protein E6J49_09175 [Chloroflexi bacterium]|nr:MAG: hypothetical protein E6J49_09175 [Chloroflexota bacterium]
MRWLVIALAITLTSCITAPVSHGCDGPANDHVMLVDRLRCSGLRVEIGDRVTTRSLRPTGTVLKLSGGGLQTEARVYSFAYDDTDLGTDGRAVAEADAKKFAPDGTLADPGAVIAYDGPPHLYRRQRVIAIYAGSDAAVTSLLTRLLGPQFAGR